MVLMLLVVACYTVCGLSDKYSVAKLKFDGNSFTFLMALPTAVLLLRLCPIPICTYSFAGSLCLRLFLYGVKAA